MKAILLAWFVALLLLALGETAWAATQAKATQAQALEPPAEQLLPEHGELLPASFDPTILSPAFPEHVSVGASRLFRVFPYGPGVYLLVVEMATETIYAPVQNTTLSSPSALFPSQQRLWILLLELPGDRWPEQGQPKVLGTLSVQPACSGSLPGGEDETEWSDALEFGDHEDLTASLAIWRWQNEPVIELVRPNALDGSGGGSHFANAWYLAVGSDGVHSDRELLPLVCAPANAGFWSKASYDMRGNIDEPGQDENIFWTLQPGDWDPAETSQPPLYLLEWNAGEACVRARYAYSGWGAKGSAKYVVERGWKPASRMILSSGSFRPCSLSSATR
ncbi:MAG: hypothetical protein QM599_01125 [Pseudoxanthomonas sp.]